MQYVRETSNPLHINLGGNRFDVFHNRDKPVAQNTKEHKKKI